ncbi:MAG: cytochrome c [Nitrospirae bacterium]|nr:cytochrome c [Nitrospirota bacterium]
MKLTCRSGRFRSRSLKISNPVYVLIYGLILTMAVVLPLAQSAVAHEGHAEGAHVHKELQGIKCPITGTKSNLREGCDLYGKYCASCHGISGKGDGQAGKNINPPPSNLSSKVFKHGSTQGEIHMIITDGVAGTAMPAFGKSMKDEDIWKLVLVVRAIKRGSSRGTHQDTCPCQAKRTTGQGSPKGR